MRHGIGTAILAMLAIGGAAAAQGTRPPPAATIRCERYATAATDLLARWDMAGLGRAFLNAHAAFLASGCTARTAICPRTDAETDLANALTVAAMNAGAASTFVPFACPGSP